jgi:hypothetical protein
LSDIAISQTAIEPFEVRRRSTSEQRIALRRRRPYTPDEILVALRRWTQQYGEPPSTVDWEPSRARRNGQSWRADRFEAGNWPTTRIVRARYGTFNAAVEEAGLVTRQAPTRLRSHLADPSAVLDAIVEWTRRYGDVPAMADWDPVRARRLQQDWRIARYGSGDWPSTRTVLTHFGSFAAAIRCAGLAPRERSLPAEAKRDRRTTNRLRLAQRRALERPPGAEELAGCIKAVADARNSGDPVALDAALIDVAAAALTWAEMAH